MRNFIQIIETLFRDPQLAKTQFNIYTTAQDHPAVKELLKRKGITAHETPAKSKIGKITLTIEGTNLLYDELDRALKMAALSGTNLSVYRAPRAGDITEGASSKMDDEKKKAVLDYYYDMEEKKGTSAYEYTLRKFKDVTEDELDDLIRSQYNVVNLVGKF